MSFAIKYPDGFRDRPYTAPAEWEGEQFQAGFFGRAFTIKGKTIEESFLETFPEVPLFRLKQVHSNIIHTASALFQAPSRTIEGDGIIFWWDELQGRAVGIITADCVPLIGLGDFGGILVHAGWRGLASGIVTSAVKQFANNIKDLSTASFAIGPCAGSARYEVGSEVIDQIGERAIAKKLSSGKWLLDLAKTAEGAIVNEIPDAKIFQSQSCTISNPEWYSHRREGVSVGNLAFVVGEKTKD